MLDKLNDTGENGNSSGYVSSSSNQQQLDGFKPIQTDCYTELTGNKNCSKTPMQSTQWQKEMKRASLFHNNLENHIHKLNIGNCEDGAMNNNLPPRLKNKHIGKHFQTQRPGPGQPKESVNEHQFEMRVRHNWDNPSQRNKQGSLRMMPEKCNTQKEKTNSDPWNDWETSVVAPVHVMDDEDLDEIITVSDNDNMDDVMVQQYVNALHQKASGASKATPSKATPSRIQALGNLKSTTNADSYQVPPGTIPNPPKGPDRWGGKELKDIDGPTGWGELVEDSRNWYDDGSNLWSTTLPQAKETVDKCIGAGKHGSTADSVCFSSTQLQQEEIKVDSCVDSAGGADWSKASMSGTQSQGDIQTASLFQNELENHKEKVNVAANEDSASNINLPPRFRNKRYGKHYQTQKPQPGQPKESVNEQLTTGASHKWDNPNDRNKESLHTTSEKCNTQKEKTNSDPWDDWDTSVVAPVHVIDDEDLEDIIAISDNDNMDDVMVQQYVNALHKEKASCASKATPSKATPSRIQALGNLKSTTNADCYQAPPGTMPNPPKGPDRWGGKELKGIDSPTGWGEPVDNPGNWYDDGSTLWSNSSTTTGGWSWNS
ncbi:uncharacterized protein LOC111320977 isoform X2 [Stylophora pistillata]|nr:uncharacterized protein LOC111320977 isoform X2 [Stylophora pistillata]